MDVSNTNLFSSRPSVLNIYLWLRSNALSHQLLISNARAKNLCRRRITGRHDETCGTDQTIRRAGSCDKDQSGAFSIQQGKGKVGANISTGAAEELREIQNEAGMCQEYINFYVK